MSTTPSARATSSDAGESLPTLTLSELACRRGNRMLFRGVSFAVRPGQATWLRGRNGRGKTSLLRLAAGLAVPESGKILWGDAPVRDAPHYAPKRVFVGHANAMKDDLTVTESLTFLARLHARPGDPESIRSALERVGMGSRRDAFVRTLSQGQRRRAALARLVLDREPAIWILDEPYDALDVDGVQVVNGLLHEHLQRGGSVLLTSHLSPGEAAPTMVEFDLDPFA